MARKAVPIVLMILGIAILLGIGLFAFDKATSAEPDGLGTWIFTVLGLILGASAGIKGWVDWNKKDPPSHTTNITANDDSQIAAGEHGRNIKLGDHSQYIERYHEAPKVERPFSPLHQLPQPPADFTGRELLITQLLEDFNSHKGATISGLIGMGGIGKTALGLVVAHRITQDYPDAQIFLDLKGTTTPLSAMDIMRHVILSFEPTMDLRALDETNMSAACQSVLHGKQVLLFLDNARSAEQIGQLHPPETCAMLVTSRWAFSVPGLRSRRVDVMSEENAQAFLLELCPRIGDAEQAAPALAKACAYLPLALRIAGSFLEENNHWSVKQYLERLNDRKERQSTLEDSRSQIDLSKEHPNLLATFELSYHGLSEENRKRWRMLGVFPISFDSFAAGAMWHLDPEGNETTKLLGLLRRYSLLDYDETSSRYGLHDLLGDYALSQTENGEEGEARLIHASHYKDVLRASNNLYEEGGEKVLTGLRLFDLEWENIRTGQAWVAAAQGSDSTLSELCIAYPDAGVDVLSLRQHPVERIQWSEAALSAAREIGDRRGEENALGNLGLAYKDLGDARKAIEFHEQALVIDREIGDRRGEGADLGNLGLAYYRLGDAHKAIEFHEQALVIDREIGDRRGEALSSWNLGLAYEKAGELNKAVEAMQICINFEREIGHPDAEKDAAIVEELRKKLHEGGGGEPSWRAYYLRLIRRIMGKGRDKPP